MERFNMEDLYNKVGGVFRLTVLVQKRLKQLNTGSKPLIETNSKNLREIVYQEIMEDKIKLISCEDGEEEDIVEENVAKSVKEMFQKSETGISLPSLK